MDIKQQIKWWYSNCGINDLMLCTNRVPRVFCFHGVDFLINTDVEGESLPVQLFVQQINWIKSRFHIISIEEFDRKFKQKCLENKDVVITFDDGYESMLRIVDPILRCQGIPYTVFVTTDNVTTGNLFPTTINRLVVVADSLQKIMVPSLNINCQLNSRDERMLLAAKISKYLKTEPIEFVSQITNELLNNLTSVEYEKLQTIYSSTKMMNWNQVRELATKGGVTIGSHTCHHIVCHDKQRVSDIKKELQESKQIIEKELCLECQYFAFPNGNSTPESRDIARETYSLSFSTNAIERISNESDPAFIPRISATYDFDYFKRWSSHMPKHTK